jgi:hypothetical protein
MGQDCCACVRAYWLVKVNLNSFASDVERKRLGAYFCKRLDRKDLTMNQHNKKCQKPDFSFLHIDYSLSAGPYNVLQIRKSVWT